MRCTPRRFLLYLLFGVACLAQSLQLEGFGTSTSVPDLRARFPLSRHQFWHPDGHIDDPANPAPGASGRYVVFPAPTEPAGPVQRIELQLANGATRRVLLSLERSSPPNAPFESRHPPCQALLADLTRRYGKPQGPIVELEERLENRNYNWRNATGKLTLLCGRYMGRTREFAMEIRLEP